MASQYQPFDSKVTIMVTKNDGEASHGYSSLVRVPPSLSKISKVMVINERSSCIGKTETNIPTYESIASTR